VKGFQHLTVLRGKAQFLGIVRSISPHPGAGCGNGGRAVEVAVVVAVALARRVESWRTGWI
jgi:hypothetical protein